MNAGKQARRHKAGAAQAGSRIHQGLVGERALIGTRYLDDPQLRAEYQRDIAPRTDVALQKILGEVFPRPQPRRGPRRMLDLAAGTGAAGAAARDYFPGDLELVAVDRVALPGITRAADITDVPALSRMVGSGGPFDLLVAAHAVNELFLDEAAPRRPARLAELLGRWCQELLADGGTLIVIEPALRETSRVLLAVRDHLLSLGLHIVAPCFFTGPCPALLRERDWCHDAVAAPPPPPGARPAHRIDFSYLVVRASGDAVVDSTLFRVVSDPLPEKGRLKLFACGSSGRQPLIRLDRHAAPANSTFDQLARGDVARIARTTFAQDGLRLGEETAVERVAAIPRR